MKKGYIAAVLDDDFAENLARKAEFKNVFCKHVTMAYNPSDEVFNKYAPLLGGVIVMSTTRMCKGDGCQAVVVRGVPSENEVPHITISCADGVKPATSNAMLRNPKKDQLFLQVGTATVRFIQHQGG
jgi:Fungal tRNA ligase phosphodiesterase domain